MYQQNNSANSNQAMIPECKQALDNMKYEIAGELGINLKQGYNGDLPSRQAGSIGGYMVNLMLPEERFYPCLQLPPIRFSRPGLRNHRADEVAYLVQIGLIL